MKTKKYYMIPAMKAVEIESVTLLAGSGTQLGAGAEIGGTSSGGDAGDEEWVP